MNEDRGYAQLQLWVLRGEVDRVRERRCREIVQQARQAGDDLLRQTFGEARRRMTTVIREERQRERQALQAARAAQATRRRQRQLARQEVLLERGLPLLVDALQRRWQSPAHRRAWVAMVLDRGMAILPRQPWTIHHPVMDAVDEATWVDASLLAQLEAHCGGACGWVPDPALAGGIILESQGVRVDGTVAGLLGDGEGIKARLLALIMELKEEPS